MITRTYGARNEVLTERQTGSSTSLFFDTLVTRYVYDLRLHLRYKIDDEGGVTEYRYDAQGRLTDTIDYPESRFDIGGLGADSAPGEAQLNAWRDGIVDRSSVKILSNRYDARGNLIATIRYAAATTAGTPLESAGDIRTAYAYDLHGRLLTRSDSGGRGESFAYDGLDRIVMSAASNGDTLHTVLLDSQRQTAITHIGGRVEIMSYDAAGGLLTAAATDMPGATAQVTSYRYDRLERLRVATDANGSKRYQLFDAWGRKIADISALGEMTEYRYDAIGRLIATVRYAGTVSTEALASLDNVLTAIDPAQIRPSANAGDRWSWQVHGENGVVQAIDGDGFIAAYRYDDAGQVVETTHYSTALSKATLDGLKATPPQQPLPVSDNPFFTPVVQSFYDRAGREIGTIDGEGHLTTFRYDASGQKIEEIAYANAVPATSRSGAWFDTIRNSVQGSAADRQTRYAYDGIGQLRYIIQADGRVTEYRYDNAGRRTATIDYGAIAGMPSAFRDIEAALQRLGAADWSGIRKQWSVYDPWGRLAFSVDPGNAVTGYGYHELGRLVRTVAYAIPFATSGLPGWGVIGDWAGTEDGHPQNRVIRNYYDARGQLAYTVDGEGYVTGNNYDARGLLVRVTRWAQPAAVQDGMSVADLVRLLGSDSIALRYGYDALGRLADSWDGEGVRRHFEYNADGSVRTDTAAYGTPDQARTRFDYDGAGRLVARYDADGGAAQGITRYTYDVMGNVTSVTDPGGNVTLMCWPKPTACLPRSRWLRGSSSSSPVAFSAARTPPARSTPMTRSRRWATPTRPHPRPPPSPRRRNAAESSARSFWW